MNGQVSMFDGNHKLTINKPIRLIELFAGYGSQAFALKYLGIPFEHWKICEWAVKSIQAYKDAHFTDDNKDYSKDYQNTKLIETLFKIGISANYNEPMTKQQIERLPEHKIRQIYNNIMATHNLVNIQQTHAKDLEITDTDKYTYIMTYSFPCQDLSLAGKQAGMEKGSGTRSGMLWEVERILDECDNLPQILLMENVPEVIGTNNIKHFAQWVKKLESLGYKNKWEVLNGKDFGIPQNRERCFMISWSGDFYYDFPNIEPLKNKLKDLLEDEVDEKYYLSDKAITGKVTTNFQTNKLESVIPNQIGIMPTICARDYKDPKCIIESADDTITINGKTYPVTKNNENFIEWKQKGFLDSDCRAWKDDKVSGTITTRVDASNSTAVYTGYRIRKLTPKECFRLMGVRDADFENIAKNQSNASLYHLAGDSIIVNVLMAIFQNLT